MDDLLAEFDRRPAEAVADRARRARLWTAGGVAALCLVGLGGIATGAIYTDEESMGNSSFTSGTVDIAAATDGGGTSTLFAIDAMAPGDVVYRSLTVNNQGTLGLRYSLTGSADDADGRGLNTKLQFTVRPMAGSESCNDSLAATEGPLYTGAIGEGTLLFGSPAAEISAGDRGVVAGGSDRLCVTAFLPNDTDNTFEGARTQLTLVFNAEQTANNG
jgi:spore coat-associated protein N